MYNSIAEVVEILLPLKVYICVYHISKYVIYVSTYNYIVIVRYFLSFVLSCMTHIMYGAIVPIIKLWAIVVVMLWSERIRRLFLKYLPATYLNSCWLSDYNIVGWLSNSKVLNLES